MDCVCFDYLRDSGRFVLYKGRCAIADVRGPDAEQQASDRRGNV